MASHDLSNTKTAILRATPGAILGIDGNPHDRFSFALVFSERFFKKWGGPHAQEHCCKITIGKSQMGRAKHIVRFFWGGGGETYYRVPPPKPLLEASGSGICLVCARFLQMTGREQMGGGGTYNRWGGGVQNCFWGGVYVFPFPEFSTPPLCFSLTQGIPPTRSNHASHMQA